MQTDFLALDFSRITSHEPGFAQGFAQGLVVAHQGAGDAVANCASLAGTAATGDPDSDVQLVVELRRPVP